MSFLSAYDGTERVAIPHPESDEYWVDLRKCLLHGATEKAALALQEMEMVAGKPQPAPNLRKHQDERLLASIVGWNIGDSPTATPWPITMQSIKRLPEPVWELLHSKVEELNRARTTKEQAQFPAEDGSGDPTSGDAGAAGAVDVPGGEGAVAAAGPEA